MYEISRIFDTNTGSLEYEVFFNKVTNIAGKLYSNFYVKEVDEASMDWMSNLVYRSKRLMDKLAADYDIIYSDGYNKHNDPYNAVESLRTTFHNLVKSVESIEEMWNEIYKKYAVQYLDSEGNLTEEVYKDFYKLQRLYAELPSEVLNDNSYITDFGDYASVLAFKAIYQQTLDDERELRDLIACGADRDTINMKAADLVSSASMAYWRYGVDLVSE